MPTDNFDPEEDPLPNAKNNLAGDDEEEEGGAGVDYRRMFKGKDQKRFHTIPKRGEKDFEPDGTNKQQRILQEGREAMYMALSADAGLKARAATGVWIGEYEMTHVPKELCSGPWFRTIGVGAPSGYWLLPEETLLMMSSGRMELLDEDGFEMSLLGAWSACIEPAGGVNKYLIYSHLRRAGYNVFRPGTLKDNSSPASSKMSGEREPSITKYLASVVLYLPRKSLLLALKLLVYLYILVASLIRSLPSWLIPRPHQPYDAIYATLPPISSFSEPFPKSTDISRLHIDFEVWRPNPAWKRKSPGPPDFHICVLDARDRYPSLAQLEDLYNNVAQRHPIGEKGGKVILAVVDNGVSNYLSLGDNLLISPCEIEQAS